MHKSGLVRYRDDDKNWGCKIGKEDVQLEVVVEQLIVNICLAHTSCNQSITLLPSFSNVFSLGFFALVFILSFLFVPRSHILTPALT